MQHICMGLPCCGTIAGTLVPGDYLVFIFFPWRVISTQNFIGLGKGLNV